MAMGEEKDIREQLKNFYNQSAEGFSCTRGTWWSSLDFIKEYIPENGKVLDFGCGNGRFFKFLKDNNFKGEYTGVDISRNLVQIAKSRFPVDSFREIDREDELPFKDRRFDFVIALAVFHHFNPSMAEGALRELRRVVRKESVIILTVWSLWNKKYLKFLWENIKRGEWGLSAKISFEFGNEKYWRYCYWWRLNSLARVIKKSKLKIIDKGFTFDKRGRKRNMYFVLKKHGQAID